MGAPAIASVHLLALDGDEAVTVTVDALALLLSVALAALSETPENVAATHPRCREVQALLDEWLTDEEQADILRKARAGA